jgi:pilus assembly protein CpaB
MSSLPLIERLSQRPALLGAVLALIVFVGAFALLSGADSSSDGPVVEEVERGMIVVATSDIAIRDLIGELQVQLREVPVETIHPLALQSLEDAVDMFATTDITSGQQLLSAHVTDDDTGGGLARLVPMGQRAYAIAVSDAIAAGGLIVPGDRIDILALFEDRENPSESTVTAVAGDLEVIAVKALLLGVDIDEEEDTRAAAGADQPTRLRATVTVAVDLLQAEQIALAEQFGSLRLIVRNPGDAKALDVNPVQLGSLTIGG